MSASLRNRRAGRVVPQLPRTAGGCGVAAPVRPRARTHRRSPASISYPSVFRDFSHSNTFFSVRPCSISLSRLAFWSAA